MNSVLQNIEYFIRKNRLEERDFEFLLGNNDSKFVVYEKPPSIYEFSKINNILSNLKKANVSI